MKRSLALVSVAGLFLLGIVIGALGMHLIQAERRYDPSGPPRGGMHGIGHVERLARLLELTPEQKDRVGEILEQSRAEARGFHEEMLPRVREQMRQTRERIEEVLTPGQRARLDELARHERGRFERYFLGEHGPPPGRPGNGPF